MMIYGIGTDIVQIRRIGESIERFGDRFAKRVLADEEIEEYWSSHHRARFLAKRFAAKEAVAKALGTGFRYGLAFDEIRVVHDRSGKPGIAYSGCANEQVRAAHISGTLITLADERDYVVAFAIAVQA